MLLYFLDWNSSIHIISKRTILCLPPVVGIFNGKVVLVQVRCKILSNEALSGRPGSVQEQLKQYFQNSYYNLINGQNLAQKVARNFLKLFLSLEWASRGIQ